MAYNPRLSAVLQKASWKEGRNEFEIAQEYKRIFGSSWIPEAEPFVRSFGGLTIDKNLWVYPERAAHDLPLRSRVESVVGSSACPVATSGYMGDGATLWIDSKERFYVVDSEGMLFVGKNIEEALNVLFLGEKPPIPPEDIRESILQAWEWKK